MDDLKPLFSAYNASSLFNARQGTKNIDSFIASSVSFMNAHVQVTDCSPSRASFLTSLRPETLPAFALGDNVLGSLIGASRKLVNTGKEILTLPQVFKMNGYKTFGIGKIFKETEYNLLSDPLLWTRPVYTYKKTNTSRPYYVDPYDVANWYDFPLNPPNDDDQAFADGQIVEVAKDLFHEFALTPNDPWFFAIGFYKPHLPWTAPGKYFKTLEKSVADLPFVVHDSTISGLRDVYDNIAFGKSCTEPKEYPNGPRFLGGSSTSDTMRNAVLAYHACVLYIDEQIGKVLHALQEAGLDDRTHVVMIADHGFHLGDHGKFCKHTNQEPATKAPFIIRPAPKMKFGNAGTRSYAPVEMLDLMPTLMDLVGISTNMIDVDANRYRKFEGVSLLPILRDPINGHVKAASASQYYRPEAGLWGYSVRTTRYRLTMWCTDSAKLEAQCSFSQLYDYANDQWETKSLSLSNANLLANMTSLAMFGAFRNVGRGTNSKPFDFEHRFTMMAQIGNGRYF